MTWNCPYSWFFFWAVSGEIPCVTTVIGFLLVNLCAFGQFYKVERFVEKKKMVDWQSKQQQADLKVKVQLHKFNCYWIYVSILLKLWRKSNSVKFQLRSCVGLCVCVCTICLCVFMHRMEFARDSLNLHIRNRKAAVNRQCRNTHTKQRILRNRLGINVFSCISHLIAKFRRHYE